MSSFFWSSSGLESKRVTDVHGDDGYGCVNMLLPGLELFLEGYPVSRGLRHHFRRLTLLPVSVDEGMVSDRVACFMYA